MRDGSVKPLPTKVNMLWNSAGSLTYLACQWLITVFVVRLSAGYDAAGMLSLAMSVTSLFSTFANYKMGTYQISDVNHENSAAEYLGFRLLTITLSFGACMVYTALTCVPQALATVALYYVFTAVDLVISTLHGVDQLGGRMDYIGKSFIMRGVGNLAVFVVVFYLTQSLNVAIVGMTLSMVAVMVVYDIPRAHNIERLGISLSRKKALFFLKTSLPAVIASVAASAIITVPKQYLAFEMGESMLGIYSSVAAPALIIQMGASYIYTPLLSIYPQLFFEGRRREFWRLLLRTVGGIVVVGVVCAIGLELIGEWALCLIFGESIAPYVYLLQPIILTTILTAFLWLLGDLLIALRNFAAYFAGNCLALAVVVPLSFLCVNTWDMNGVSFASSGACAVGIVVLLAGLLRTARRQFGEGSAGGKDAS